MPSAGAPMCWNCDHKREPLIAVALGDPGIRSVVVWICERCYTSAYLPFMTTGRKAAARH